LEKWKNGVGERVETNLKKELAKAESVIEVQMYNRVTGEYSVQLTNSRCLVVNPSSRECSCGWWQGQGIPCKHAMTVIKKDKKWVYEYVDVVTRLPRRQHAT